jgi:hypothetical protein
VAILLWLLATEQQPATVASRRRYFLPVSLLDEIPDDVATCWSSILPITGDYRTQYSRLIVDHR